MNLNDAVRGYYKKEINYGGGDGGIEFAKTAPVNTTSWAAFNYFAGNLKYSGVKFIRKKLKGPGQGAQSGKIVTVGKEFPQIEFSYYLQTAADPFKALAIGTTQGQSGDSYIFNFLIPDPTDDTATVTLVTYGNQLEEYVIDSTIPGLPIVTLKWSCYDMEIDAGPVDMSGIAYPAGVINEWDDVTITIDTDAITELRGYNLTIKNVYSQFVSGRNSSFDKFKPLLKFTDVIFKPLFTEDAAAIIGDSIVQTLNSFPISWTDGTNTIGATNCYVDIDDLGNFTGDDITEVIYEPTIFSGDSVLS